MSGNNFLWKNGEEEHPDEEEEPVCDEEDGNAIVRGDMRQCIAIHKVFIEPHLQDPEDWLWHNVFQTTCTIGGRVCKLIIDSRSCENIISQEVVSKLILQVEVHPHPHKLSWFKKGNEVQVTKRCLVDLSIGNRYFNKLWCDVFTMDAYHILFGRPWQYDNKVQHDGHMNTYTFCKNSKKIILVPSKERVTTKTQKREAVNLLSMAKFLEEMEEKGIVYVLVGKEEFMVTSCLAAIRPLLEEFFDVMSHNLLPGLPPMRDIQHHVDLVLRASLPNKPHYRMSPNEHEELERQVSDLLEMGYVCESKSPCVVPTLLVPKKDRSWRMFTDSRAINKITIKYRFPIPRLRKNVLKD